MVVVGSGADSAPSFMFEPESCVTTTLGTLGSVGAQLFPTEYLPPPVESATHHGHCKF